MRMFAKVLPRALAVLAVATVALGVVYPSIVTLVGQVFFPCQANGSIMVVDGREVGSELVAQWFDDDAHLWGRPMVADADAFTDSDGDVAFYARPTNLSPSSEEEATLVSERVARLEAADPDQDGEAIPVDLVTVSGSGLDPDISPAAAEYQVSRVAKASGLGEDEVREIISSCTEGRLLGVFGEERVNVLKVNLAIDDALGR
jgi:K+-transporting ATPase ATPase C chain